MHPLLCFVCVGSIAYLIGSFPSGYIAGRIRGIDIRKVGSGNPGATNVTRVLGKRFGYPVFVTDFLKGLVPVLLARALAHRCQFDPIGTDFCVALSGIFSVLGHSYPLWLGFKGGKGVATSLGVIFGISWIAALIMCAVWVAVFKTTRYVSIASIAAAIALPVAMITLLSLHQLRSTVLVYFSLFLAAIVVIRHRSNMSRLLSGTEPRFSRK
ncbi:MAG TPA: glycerol-3-phosphate 1-O-acyltransferase PlsY [Chthoniobacterales bacterium]|nr:glycerol-3-phosphate 1-O-acyltransferase PlsY [Chthoniobacterales bacterium]